MTSAAGTDAFSSLTAPTSSLPRSFWLHPARTEGSLAAPPSKSYTHRALVVGALASGPVLIRGALLSEDTQASLRALQALGGTSNARPPPEGGGAGPWIEVSPPARGARGGTSPAVADVGESGTTLRLFSAVAGAGAREVLFEGAPSLARRPLSDLLQALDRLGAVRQGPPEGRSLPFRIHGPLRSGRVEVPGHVSSQFISALLFVLPVVAGTSELVIRGPRVSEPYVEATLAVLKGQGVRVEATDEGFSVPGDQRYPGGTIEVPGDASSAAYWFAMAALTGGRVHVSSLPSGPPQADLAVLDILERTGARVERGSTGVTVQGASVPLQPFEVDLDPSPDLAPLLAVMASFAHGTSVLVGGAHLASKESDRREGSLLLARALGAAATDEQGELRIRGPTTVRRLELLDLHDHRLLFAACVAASALPAASHLGDGGCAAKSHPLFLRDLAKLGLRVTAERDGRSGPFHTSEGSTGRSGGSTP